MFLRLSSDEIIAYAGSDCNIYEKFSKNYALTYNSIYNTRNLVNGMYQSMPNIWAAGKGDRMDEEINVGELLKETAEENQTRKI